jgi:hypothetical protein
MFAAKNAKATGTPKNIKNSIIPKRKDNAKYHSIRILLSKKCYIVDYS